MKILLIYPYFLEERNEEEEISALPTGLYYIAALLLEQGYDTEILNFYRDGRNPQKIREILAQKNPDIVGISIFNANRLGGIEIAHIVKEVNPQSKVVFGGVGATFLWEHLLRNFPQIDYVVLGEGEYTFLQLVNSGGDPAAINGIAFRNGSQVIRTPPAEPIKDLDKLPNPARYFTYKHLSLTRGCPGNCTYCGSPRFWGHKVRFHSVSYFVDQLELLYRKGVNFFYISDDIFTMKKEVAINVCKEILNRSLSISWYAISHVDNVDEEILHWMRKAGCIQISYGVESGSEKIRNRLNKRITNEQVKRAFALTTRYGILARAYIIYACPGESSETISETEELIRQIKPHSIIFYVLRVFPGTALYDEVKQRLQITDDVWLNPMEDILYLETDPGLVGEEVLTFRNRLRKAFYEGLPSFVDAIELVDSEEFHPLHADFLSRLGMTFSHGDYAEIEAIPDREAIAVRLFKRALRYAPHPRAYLGLAMIHQKNRAHGEAIELLPEAIQLFPENEPLHICLAVSLMNLGKFGDALSRLMKFQDSPDAQRHIEACREMLSTKHTKDH
ncbi:MAG: radical SAM protein [Syntrophobacteraceae bacterium]|nr:radical SAM protein [Syntrophobacteraceae bacterium]